MGARAVPQLILGLVLAIWSTAVLAHHAGAQTVWSEILALLLAASGVIYAVGVAKLWCKAGLGRGIRRVEVTRFAASWLVLAIALSAPVDALSDRSFAAHMAEHELLMVIAAPLLVMSRPLAAFAWAMPARVARTVKVLAGGIWRPLTTPVGAWSTHAVALWLWHIPVLFAAAQADPTLHVLQHACFFVSALLFWWIVLASTGRAGVAMLALFTTMLHTSALGMLITFAPEPWYPPEESILGFTALEDQQLGGLIMWVPGGLVYVAAGLAVVAGWLTGQRARAQVCYGENTILSSRKSRA